MRARLVVIACLVCGAALILFAALGHGWGSLGKTGEVGLLDTVGCAPAATDEGAFGVQPWVACTAGLHGTTTATRIEGEQFARLGQLALILAVLAAIGALAAIHARLARVLTAPVSILAIGAVAASTAFAITEPFYQAGEWWRPGIAWWELVIGAALVIAGVRLGPAAGPRRWPAWLALAIAAPLLAGSARSTSWWRSSVTRPAIAIGPAMVEACPPGTACQQLRLGDAAGGGLRPEGDGWGLPAPQAALMASMIEGSDGRPSPARLGQVPLVLGRAIAVLAAVAAALAAALALSAAARRRVRRLAWATAVAAGATIVAVVAFEATLRAGVLVAIAPVHRSFGMPVAIVSALVAIGAAVLELRVPGAVIATPGGPVVSDDGMAIASAAPPRPMSASILGAVPAVAPPSCPTCQAPMLWVSRRGLWLCTVCKARDSVPT